MEIFHHFGVKISEEEKQQLTQLGIQLKHGQPLSGRIFAGFEIGEADPRWDEIEQLVADLKITDRLYEVFPTRAG